MNYFPDRDLFYHIESFGAQSEKSATTAAFFPNSAARTIMRKICTAIRQVHHLNIAHFDLKPENFLIEGNPEKRGLNNVFVCDFGYASCMPKDGVLLDGGVRGTAGYMSPECAAGERYGLPADVWSIGAIAHVLLTGHVPFHNEFYNVLQMYKDRESPLAIRGNQNIFQLDRHALNFIERTMQYNPKDRLTIDELLQHAWFKNRNTFEEKEHYEPISHVGLKRKSCYDE